MITGVAHGAVETLEGLCDQMKTDLDFRQVNVPDLSLTVQIPSFLWPPSTHL